MLVSFLIVRICFLFTFLIVWTLHSAKSNFLDQLEGGTAINNLVPKLRGQGLVTFLHLHLFLTHHLYFLLTDFGRSKAYH